MAEQRSVNLFTSLYFFAAKFCSMLDGKKLDVRENPTIYGYLRYYLLETR